MDEHIPQEAKGSEYMGYLYTGEHLAMKEFPSKHGPRVTAPLRVARIGEKEIGIALKMSDNDLTVIAEVDGRRFFISAADLVTAAHRVATRR